MSYDLIIIGGGPAGITAGIYAARRKIKTLLLAKDFWGQISKTSRVDNYPGFSSISGMELMKKLEEHLKSFSLDIKENVLAIEVSKENNRFLVKTKDGSVFSSRALLVASGREPKELGVPGEKEFFGKGVSHCSICDAPFFQDKKVAVAGGGNSALNGVLDLMKYAQKISVLVRDSELLADEVLREETQKSKKIEFYFNTEILAIEGREKVESLSFRNLKTSKIFKMPIDGLFVNVGSLAVKDFLRDLAEFDERGDIKVNPSTLATSLPGLFAAGDVNNGKWKQFVIAAGEGAKAALAAYEYLGKLKSQNSF